MHVGEFIPNSRGGISFVTSKTRCSSTVGKGKGSQYGNHIGRSLAGASLMTMARQSERFRIHFQSFSTISGWRIYTGSWFWIRVRLRNQVRTRWANLFWERIYKWIIQIWSIQCMPTRKRSSAVTLQSRMQTRWCLSMKIQRFTLVIVNDQGPVQTGSDKFKPDFESVWTKDRALNRATLKKSRRLRRGLTLTEHINQRLRQNQRSAKQRNEFLPTGSFLNISLLGTSLFLDLIDWFFENICKRWKTSWPIPCQQQLLGVQHQMLSGATKSITSPWGQCRARSDLLRVLIHSEKQFRIQFKLEIIFDMIIKQGEGTVLFLKI